jgi:hypothetical protein
VGKPILPLVPRSSHRPDVASMSHGSCRSSFIIEYGHPCHCHQNRAPDAPPSTRRGFIHSGSVTPSELKPAADRTSVPAQLNQASSTMHYHNAYTRHLSSAPSVSTVRAEIPPCTDQCHPYRGRAATRCSDWHYKFD